MCMYIYAIYMSMWYIFINITLIYMDMLEISTKNLIHPIFMVFYGR